MNHLPHSVAQLLKNVRNFLENSLRPKMAIFVKEKCSPEKQKVFAVDWNSAYTQPTHLIFGMVKDAANIYYCTKNQVGGLCVGGDIVILFFWFVPW